MSQASADEQELFEVASRIAVRDLKRLRKAGSPMSSFAEIAQRAVARASRERQQPLTTESLRWCTTAIVERLRRRGPRTGGMT